MAQPSSCNPIQPIRPYSSNPPGRSILHLHAPAIDATALVAALRALGLACHLGDDPDAPPLDEPLVLLFQAPDRLLSAGGVLQLERITALYEGLSALHARRSTRGHPPCCVVNLDRIDPTALLAWAEAIASSGSGVVELTVPHLPCPTPLTTDPLAALVAVRLLDSDRRILTFYEHLQALAGAPDPPGAYLQALHEATDPSLLLADVARRRQLQQDLQRQLHRLEAPDQCLGEGSVLGHPLLRHSPRSFAPRQDLADRCALLERGLALLQRDLDHYVLLSEQQRVLIARCAVASRTAAHLLARLAGL